MLEVKFYFKFFDFDVSFIILKEVRWFLYFNVGKKNG